MVDDRDVNLRSGINAFESRHFALALKFLSPFADAGHADAQYRMAIMYQNGLGIVANETKAYRNMKAAAEQDLALAQHGLGFMYMEGECTEANAGEAIHWFTKAAEQGLVGSQATLARIYGEGLGIPVDLDQARKWYRQAGFDDMAESL